MPVTVRQTALVLLLFGWLAFAGACELERNSWESCVTILEPGPDVQARAQGALDRAGRGCTVAFTEGEFHFSETLTLEGKSGVTVQGAGRGLTTLSFTAQTSGDGLLVTGSQDILLQHFTVRDSHEDAIKIRESHGLRLTRLAAVWSGTPSTDNGEYGFYPVLSSDILIEHCYAYGASDAGIYVGLSDRAVIRNSTAEANVIGIEVTNATAVDIHGNLALDNTAGIVISSLPGLPRSGERTRVFDNRVLYNQMGNFAHEDEVAAEVPAGTGILALGANRLEIFDNTVTGNNLVGAGITGYLAFVELNRFSEPGDPDFDPYPRQVYLHDNRFSRGAVLPDTGGQSFFGKLLAETFGADSIPDILVDGIFAPQSGPSGSVCIRQNSGSHFANLNLADEFPDRVVFDLSPHRCTLDPLPPVDPDVPDDRPPA